MFYYLARVFCEEAAVAAWRVAAGSGRCRKDKSGDNRPNMADLTNLENQLDPQKETCRAIIETPKGFRNKFDYDPQSNLFLLAGLLPEGMMFPFDFGFIPSTRGDDGDPVDIMVLMDAPAHVGCLIDVRIIGIIDAEQTQAGRTEKNGRILGAAIHSYEHQNLVNIADVSKTML